MDWIMFGCRSRSLRNRGVISAHIWEEEQGWIVAIRKPSMSHSEAAALPFQVDPCFVWSILPDRPHCTAVDAMRRAEVETLRTAMS